MVILCQSGLVTFGQGYPTFGVGRPQDYRQIFTSLQRWSDMTGNMTSGPKLIYITDQSGNLMNVRLKTRSNRLLAKGLLKDNYVVCL